MKQLTKKEALDKIGELQRYIEELPEDKPEFDPEKVHLEVHRGHVLIKYIDGLLEQIIGRVSPDGVKLVPYLDEKIPIKRESHSKGVVKLLR